MKSIVVSGSASSQLVVVEGLLLSLVDVEGAAAACEMVALVSAAVVTSSAGDSALVAGQLGESGVHLVGQRLVSVLVDAQLVFLQQSSRGSSS